VRDAALVEGGAERFNEGLHIFSQEELAMTTDAGSIIQEGNQPGLYRRAVALKIGAVEGVGLPHFVGMGFGEGQADLVGALRIGLEEFVLFDNAAEGVGRDLRAGQQTLLNAQAVEQSRTGRLAAGFWKRLLHGLRHVFQRHLADFAFVRPGFVFHDGDAVFLVAGVPGLNGAPGELAGMAVLVGKGHPADSLDAAADGFALGHVNGPEHAHFQIGGGISHELYFVGLAPAIRSKRPPAAMFRSRRRRYWMESGDGDGIVALSLARKSAAGGT